MRLELIPYLMLFYYQNVAFIIKKINLKYLCLITNRIRLWGDNPMPLIVLMLVQSPNIEKQNY